MAGRVCVCDSYTHTHRPAHTHTIAHAGPHQYQRPSATNFLIKFFNAISLTTFCSALLCPSLYYRFLLLFLFLRLLLHMHAQLCLYWQRTCFVIYTHITQTHTTKGLPGGLLPVSEQQLFLIYERFGCRHRQRHTKNIKNRPKQQRIDS